MQDSRVLEYGGIYFSCIHKENIREEFSLKDHALIYLSGGRLEISGAAGSPTVDSPVTSSEAHILRLSPCECIFLRKDHHVSLAKSMAEDGTPYKAVTMTFSRRFLLEFFRSAKNSSGNSAHDRMLSSSLDVDTFADIVSTKISRSPSPLLKIPARPDVSALFQSLMPYFWSEEKPDKSWLDMKMTEGLMCILRTAPNVYASLFDFSSPWKLDLKAFMEENFTAELSLADFANYTGRSLSTFNRDFRKIFEETPEKWLIRRRLDYARELLRTKGCKIHEAMNDAGFSNLSYFSREYKAAFGVAPSKEKGPRSNPEPFCEA